MIISFIFVKLALQCDHPDPHLVSHEIRLVHGNRARHRKHIAHVERREGVSGAGERPGGGRGSELRSRF